MTLALFGSESAAQGITFLGASTFGNVATNCSLSRTLTGSSVSDSYSCGGAVGGYLHSASASAENGRLRASSSITSTDITTNAVGSSGAQSFWRDFLSVSGAGASYVDLRFDLTGSIEAWLAGDCDQFADFGSSTVGLASVYAFGNPFQLLDEYTLPQEGIRPAGCPPVPNLTPDPLYSSGNVSIPVRTSLSARVFLAGGGASLGWELKTNQNIIGRGSGSIASNFSNTMTLSAVSVFDAAGRNISSTTSYRFNSGLTLGPTTVVPEPSTLSLLCVGTLIILFRFKRRSEQTPD
jgi:hypothetical protein